MSEKNTNTWKTGNEGDLKINLTKTVWTRRLHFLSVADKEKEGMNRTKGSL